MSNFEVETVVYKCVIGTIEKIIRWNDCEWSNHFQFESLVIGSADNHRTNNRWESELENLY
jgi:hypothetical protein